MKNEILYNYNFKKPIIEKKDGVYKIRENGKNYNAYAINRSANFNLIYSIIMTTKLRKRYNIVKTINNSPYFIYNNSKYIIVEIIEPIFISDILNERIYIGNYIYSQELINDQINIWQNIINELEIFAQKSDNSSKEWLNYCIGLGESAIICAKAPNNSKVEKQIVTYKRIEIESIKNPLNIIVDSLESKFVEQLMYDYKKNTYTQESVKKIIINAQQELAQLNIIFARCIFPIRDLFKCENKPEQNLNNLIVHTSEYEKYLKMIYNEIIKYQKIKNIDWL